MCRDHAREPVAPNIFFATIFMQLTSRYAMQLTSCYAAIRPGDYTNLISQGTNIVLSSVSGQDHVKLSGNG